MIKIVYLIFLGLFSLIMSGDGFAYLTLFEGQSQTETSGKTLTAKTGSVSTSGYNQRGSLDPKILALGLKAHQCASKKGFAKRKEVLTIIDYSKPSNQKRLWIVDVKNKKVTSEQLVAHGEKSGGDKANQFSNTVNSHQSSIGVFVTGETYQGSNGLSLRLKGLEKGINHKAEPRNIVIHPASYVSKDFLNHHGGRLGRSWGCPALDPTLAQPTINSIKGGSVLFAYYPDSRWLKESAFLNC